MSRNKNSLCSPSAWLSPAEPPSASSPSPLSFGPLTHRHCSTQRRGVCEDTQSWKILNMPGKHTLTAEAEKGFFHSAPWPLSWQRQRADCSVPMETESVSHLSGVQAELPAETLVSMLSELSRLRVSYAWPPLGGDWWCRMEWCTVGARSVRQKWLSKAYSALYC